MTLKVWMTPTPSEAQRDPSHSIHNIVCRLNEHLPTYGVELVENASAADLLAGHAGQGSDTPLDVAHYHGLYPTAMGMDSANYFTINAHVIRNLRAAKAITAPSNWIADVIRRDMHVDPHIIGWGVNTEEWTPGQDPHVYALWNKARVDTVSNPAPMLALAAQVPDMPFLTTFGAGGMNVRTIGRQPYEVMKHYIRNAGVYLATVTETFGIGTLEAMACGVPVLGFNHAGTADIVEHGVTGFLAEPGDIDGLREGLAYCLQYRDVLGANAREAAKQHTWARVAQRMAAVYRRVLEPHQGVKCSIIIPCHDYGMYVDQAIESALAQETTFDYEVIVVLDRCTDNSADVAARYAERGVQIITVDHGNLSATRNTGIQHATGEYVACLDADDRIGSPQFLQTLAEALDSDRTLGIAFTSIRVMDADGNLGHLNAWPKGYDFDQQAQRRNQIPSLCLFRKEAWRRAGGFRPHFVYAQDAEFWTLVGAIGYGARHVVYDGWFHYRLHNKSQSQVHRTGEVREPDWLEFYPWTRDGLRPFAADGRAPRGSWPVRFYHTPDASIIIPVGPGHEETVKDALHSVEGQTHRFWECIVVNDTGHPLCLEGFPWARVIDTKGGVGAGAARNAGVAVAKAPFVAFLDADDLLKPHFLEMTLKAYRQSGRYAYTDWMTDDLHGHVETHQMPEYTFEAIWSRPSLHAVTALIPRAAFDAVGGFDETMTSHEDVDFYMKLLVNGFCGVRVPQPLLIYNLHLGKRRIAGDAHNQTIMTLLKERYGQFMEAREMCCNDKLPSGTMPAPPTPDNVDALKGAFGEMVKVEYTSPFAPESPVTLRGPVTDVNYGRRAKGDVFFVWANDLVEGDATFTRVEDHVNTSSYLTTVVPPPPVSILGASVDVEVVDDGVVVHVPVIDEPVDDKPVDEVEPVEDALVDASEDEPAEDELLDEAAPIEGAAPGDVSVEDELADEALMDEVDEAAADVDAEAAPVVDLDTMKMQDLIDYAEAHDIDLTGARSNADRVKLIRAAEAS